MFETFPLVLQCLLMSGHITAPVHSCTLVSSIDKVAAYECSLGRGAKCGVVDYREDLKVEVADWKAESQPEAKVVWFFQEKPQYQLELNNLGTEYDPLGHALLGNRLK